MGYNTQGRKWALVINNPQEAGLDHKAIVDLLKLFSPAYYGDLSHACLLLCSISGTFWNY